jgi:sarcosine oxidase subunit beta
VASGASGGPGRRGVRANGRDPRELPLIKRAHELWPGLHERLGCAPLFERTGHILLIERERDLAAAVARTLMQNRMGTPSKLLDAMELRDFEPEVSDAVIGGLYCPDDGVADHTATTRAYAAAARAAGAAIEEGVTATRLAIEHGRTVAVETADGGRIPVDGTLLVLANPGVEALVRPHVALPVWNLAFQVLLSRPLPQVPVRHLIGHMSRQLALKSEPGGRVMISGGYVGRWDQASGTGTPIPEEVEANVADAVATYPALEGLEVETADTGHLESLSPDGVPIVDYLPGTANALFATAWNGHGWAIAPALAELIAAWALEGRRPEALAPFGARRFGA